MPGAPGNGGRDGGDSRDLKPTLSPGDRKLLVTALEAGRALERALRDAGAADRHAELNTEMASKPTAEITAELYAEIAVQEKAFREALTKLAEAESELTRKQSEYAPKVRASLGEQHLATLLVPLERLLNRSARDEEFLYLESDQTELSAEAKELRERLPRIVICENLRSAFNVGSIFRTGECFLVNEIWLTGYTAPPSKTAMGTDEVVTWKSVAHSKDAINDAKAKGYKVIALEVSAEASSLENFEWPEKTALVLGNERFGVDSATLAECDHVLKISTSGTKNSLNVGVAFGIAASTWRRTPSTAKNAASLKDSESADIKTIQPIGFVKGGYTSPQVAPRQGSYHSKAKIRTILESRLSAEAPADSAFESVTQSPIDSPVDSCIESLVESPVGSPIDSSVESPSTSHTESSLKSSAVRLAAQSPTAPLAAGGSSEADIILTGRFDNKPSNFEQALKDLEGFSHVWLLFGFHRSQSWLPQTRPPRGDGSLKGVFATRAPHRPNGLGLSCVRLLAVTGRTLRISHHDLLDGTPIYDIKPYVPEADSIPDARAGWIDTLPPAHPIAEADQAKRKLDWLEAHSEARLRPFIFEQLRYQPFDITRKRIEILPPHEDSESVSKSPAQGTRFIAAFRTWRIHAVLATNLSKSTMTGMPTPASGPSPAAGKSTPASAGSPVGAPIPGSSVASELAKRMDVKLAAAGTITILDVTSGYTDNEIAPQADGTPGEDPYGDKDLHRRFRATFQVPPQ